MRVEAVLFDLFDTLLLLEKDEAFYVPSLKRLHQFLFENGIKVSFEDFKRIYFEVRDNLYTETKENLEEPHFHVRVSRVLRRFGRNFDVSHPLVVGATDAFADEFMHYVHLSDDTLDVLTRLHRKYKLGLISNFAIPECAWKLLDKFGLKSFFDVILISGEINKRKPSPEIFLRALNSLGVEASKTVFVGDMIGLDVKGAKNVGISPILVKRRPLQGMDVKPDRVIRSLRELLTVLQDY